MEMKNFDSVNIPHGARLQFVRIAGHNIITDEENRKFCVFTLEVRCNVASPSVWHVYRRYTEFRKLSHALRIEGYFVPVMPPKNVFGSLTPEFIEKRKVLFCEILKCFNTWDVDECEYYYCAGGFGDMVTSCCHAGKWSVRYLVVGK